LPDRLTGRAADRLYTAEVDIGQLGMRARAGVAQSAAVARSLADLGAVRRMAEEARRPDLVIRLDQIRDRLTGEDVPVAVVGEFKQGKSTLINALLRTEVCPVDADVVTAVPMIV
jgi:ribosome biogenesis GTPase A